MICLRIIQSKYRYRQKQSKLIMLFLIIINIATQEKYALVSLKSSKKLSFIYHQI